MAQSGPFTPTAVGNPSNQFTNPTRLTACDGLRSTDNTVGHKEDTDSFNFAIPAGSTINGIQLDATEANTGGGATSITVGYDLSWDGGVNYTAQKTLAISGGLGFVTDTFGGAADTWGRAWNVGEFSNANFRARANVVAKSGAPVLSVDCVQLTVFYTPPGGTPHQLTLTSCGV